MSIYGDGSFQHHLRLGAGAFFIPQLQLAGSFCGPGSSSEEFELRAVVAGLRELARVDWTTRPVKILSDSTFVITVLHSLSQRSALPPRNSHLRVRALYDEAMALVGDRKILTVKTCSKNDGHRRCHRLALTKLRDEIRANPAYASQLVLMHEEQQRESLQAARAKLEKRIEKIETELLMTDVRISALRRTVLLPADSDGVTERDLEGSARN